MFYKGSLYFADWRDRKGVRHRKSFTTEEAATDYEAAQKVTARPKKQSKGQPSAAPLLTSPRGHKAPTPASPPTGSSKRSARSTSRH